MRVDTLKVTRIFYQVRGIFPCILVQHQTKLFFCRLSPVECKLDPITLHTIQLIEHADKLHYMMSVGQHGTAVCDSFMMFYFNNKKQTNRSAISTFLVNITFNNLTRLVFLASWLDTCNYTEYICTVFNWISLFSH